MSHLADNFSAFHYITFVSVSDGPQVENAMHKVEPVSISAIRGDIDFTECCHWRLLTAPVDLAYPIQIFGTTVRSVVLMLNQMCLSVRLSATLVICDHTFQLIETILVWLESPKF